jgi:hypothetical protein
MMINPPARRVTKKRRSSHIFTPLANPRRSSVFDFPVILASEFDRI